MLKHLRFDIFELQETKLPLRLINTTNKLRLVQGHETTQLRVKGWDEKMDGDCKAKFAAGTVGFEAGVSLFTDPISDVVKCI
ncbi:hypothetical protein TNCV_2264891 [Trichonephila clavipes]|nr:hypothetical protein TNCV_2264891 [Trichonephila clavipes]